MMNNDVLESMTPEEQALLEYQSAYDKYELSTRIGELEENGHYLRNMLNQINDKLVKPATSKVMPAVTLAMTSAGTVATVALGIVYLLAKLR